MKHFQVVTSRRKAFYVYKYIFLLFGVLFFILAVVAIISPELVKGDIDLSSTLCRITLSFLALLFFVIAFVMLKKILLLQFESDGLVVLSGEVRKEVKVSWKEIESINEVFTLQPPLYILRLKTGRWYLFSTGYNFVSVNGVTLDFSSEKELFRKYLTNRN